MGRPGNLSTSRKIRGKQFMGLIMQAHQKIQPLLEEAQKTGNLKVG